MRFSFSSSRPWSRNPPVMVRGGEEQYAHAKEERDSTSINVSGCAFGVHLYIGQDQGVSQTLGDLQRQFRTQQVVQQKASQNRVSSVTKVNSLANPDSLDYARRQVIGRNDVQPFDLLF